MKRFIVIAALCVPVAGLATAFDGAASDTNDVVRITVSQDDLAECEATLRELRQRPVVTDSGWALPSFMVDDDLPRSVCVVDA
ncbi:hypothetical protein DC366_08375 [Pelagivirga sediminicola]|uniref:Uncharacterized protein n=1 Tax=Pelagivirga sediminicola TaxID=2170575 RepID=A0A2T7G764_9RHOB|nr:hypothetical protein [Pelagivirga sediminicola]PVA10254.1 hypothetical protein DC366_08375 [Pelagivirga sediminicola]